jgi:hypothetical protein
MAEVPSVVHWLPDTSPPGRRHFVGSNDLTQLVPVTAIASGGGALRRAPGGATDDQTLIERHRWRHLFDLRAGAIRLSEYAGHLVQWMTHLREPRRGGPTRKTRRGRAATAVGRGASVTIVWTETLVMWDS